MFKRNSIKNVVTEEINEDEEKETLTIKNYYSFKKPTTEVHSLNNLKNELRHKKGSLKKFSSSNQAIRLDCFKLHQSSNMFSVQEVKEECEIHDSKPFGAPKVSFMASPRVFLMDNTEDNLTPKLASSANYQLSMIDEIITE